MADLVTHLASVLLPAAFVRHRAIGVVGVGVVLPDAVSRVPGEALEALHGWGLPLPDWAVMPWGVLHAPVPLVLTSVLLSLGFRRGDRAVVCGALLAGCAVHLGLDLLQDHHGHGYPLLFPFSTATWELGWLHSEATVGLAPWLALATALAWGLRVWTQGSNTASGNTPPDTPAPPP